MKIRAAVVDEKSGPFRVAEVELAEPRDDEVLVRIVGVGVCHTDIVFQQTGADILRDDGQCQRDRSTAAQAQHAHQR